MSKSAPGTTRRLVASVLTLLLVLGVVVLGVLAYRSKHLTEHPLAISDTGSALPDQEDRHRAIAVAEQFAIRANTLDTAKLDAYAKSVSELLTTKYKADFAKTVAVLPQLVGNERTSSKDVVLVSGITDQDADSATVLVLHVKETATASGSKVDNYRWSVGLRKVGGKWLVDDFTDFNLSGE